jgi:cyclase
MTDGAGSAPGTGVTIGSGIEALEIDANIMAFYEGRDSGGRRFASGWNWVDDSAMKLGMATYVIHQGARAIVYDSSCTVEQAGAIRHYLERRGINRFTLVLSHWHLDHIGGNGAYADSPIIATTITRDVMSAQKEKIEAGDLWGPPAIKPLVLPTISFQRRLDIHLDNLEVELHNINIHSADSNILYLPSRKTLFAGDTLEDPITYVVEVENLPLHLENLSALKQMEIGKILPNHGDPRTIGCGGYDPTLIDATIAYIRRLLLSADSHHDLPGDLKEYLDAPLANGWIHYYPAYEEVHKQNLKLVHEHYGSQAARQT